MNDSQTVVRLPSDVVHKIDAIAEKMSKQRPGIKITRASLIRMFVLKGIEEHGR